MTCRAWNLVVAAQEGLASISIILYGKYNVFSGGGVGSNRWSREESITVDREDGEGIRGRTCKR